MGRLTRGHFYPKPRGQDKQHAADPWRSRRAGGGLRRKSVGGCGSTPNRSCCTPVVVVAGLVLVGVGDVAAGVLLRIDERLVPAGAPSGVSWVGLALRCDSRAGGRVADGSHNWALVWARGYHGGQRAH